jgi:acyl-CoA thioester hydrolase
MLTFDYRKRVRYGETDMMGYLYYGNYAQLYEIGRVEMMRSIGLSYRKMEEKYRVMMPVVEVQARYIKPARYDEELTIRTTLQSLPGRIITFFNDILSEDGHVIHRATVRLVFINMDTGKAVACPPYLMDGLKSYF